MTQDLELRTPEKVSDIWHPHFCNRWANLGMTLASLIPDFLTHDFVASKLPFKHHYSTGLKKWAANKIISLVIFSISYGTVKIITYFFQNLFYSALKNEEQVPSPLNGKTSTEVVDYLEKPIVNLGGTDFSLDRIIGPYDQVVSYKANTSSNWFPHSMTIKHGDGTYSYIQIVPVKCSVKRFRHTFQAMDEALAEQTQVSITQYVIDNKDVVCAVVKQRPLDSTKTTDLSLPDVKERDANNKETDNKVFTGIKATHVENVGHVIDFNGVRFFNGPTRL